MQQFRWIQRLPRVPFQTRVWLHTDAGDLVRADTTNLSEGGVFAETSTVLPAGERVTCDLSVDGHRRLLCGRVAWVRTPAHASWDQPPGMGIAFDHARADDVLVLRDAVAARTDHEVAVRVWLPGMYQPVTATAVPTRDGMVLRTKLPAFQRDCGVLVSLVDGDRELVGRLGRVHVTIDREDAVPTLEVELDIERSVSG